MLERIGVRLDSTGEMGHKVPVEGGPQLHVIHDTRPMQGIAVGQYGALVAPGNSREHVEGAWKKAGGPLNERLQESLRFHLKAKLRSHAGREVIRIDLAGFK